MTDKNKITFSKIPFYTVLTLFGLVIFLPFILPHFFPWTENYAGFDPYPLRPVRQFLKFSHLTLIFIFLYMFLLALVERKDKAYVIHYLQLFLGCLFSFILFYMIYTICDYIA